MDRRVRRTRMLIRDAFLDLLKEKPLSSLTITELAKRADIDRRTFYLHYSCIEDIFTEIENEAADALHQLLVSMKNFNISTFFEGLTKIMTDNMDFYLIISTNDQYYRFVMKCVLRLKEALKENFFESSQLSEEDFEIYSEYVASGVISLYCNWLMSSSPMPLTELTHKVELAVSNSWNLIIRNS